MLIFAVDIVHCGNQLMALDVEVAAVNLMAVSAYISDVNQNGGTRTPGLRS
jgi:hypothetical protein